MRTTNHNLSLIYSSTGTSPHELGLPVRTNMLTRELHRAWAGQFTSITSFHNISYCFGGSPWHNPYDACLEGTHTKAHKFLVKPLPILGIVGVLSKLEWYRIRTHISFISKITIFSWSYSPSKPFNGMNHHSKVSTSFQSHMFPSRVVQFLID